jgi:hypothetical protein
VSEPAAYHDSAWFRRFRFGPDDIDEVQAEVVRLEAALRARDLDPAGELGDRLRLGSMLFPLGREAAAEETLVPAVVLARELGDDGSLVAAHLHLATTRQYLGRGGEALAMFDDALDHARVTGHRRDEHFLLHHRGRCLAEAGAVAAARVSFEGALQLRLGLESAWLVSSTRAALAELDAWCAARHLGLDSPG